MFACVRVFVWIGIVFIQNKVYRALFPSVGVCVCARTSGPACTPLRMCTNLRLGARHGVVWVGAYP